MPVHDFMAFWVLTTQAMGVQLQPWGGLLGLFVSVQSVSQNGVPNRQHMHAQLVGAAGNGF